MEELKKLKAKTTNKFLRKPKGGTQLPTHSWASEGTHKDTLTHKSSSFFCIPTHAQKNTHASQVCLDTHRGPLYVGHSTWGILLCYSCVLCSTLHNTRKDKDVHMNTNTWAFSHTRETSHKHSTCGNTHTAEEIGTDSSIFSLAIVRRRTNSTTPANTSHLSDIQRDILFKEKKKRGVGGSTLELAGSVESYHIELHGCACQWLSRYIGGC